MQNRTISLEDLDKFLASNDLAEKLKKDFVKTQKNTFANINQTLLDGDRETAHRLAHSLKGLAGLIHEDTLMEAAKRVEISISLRGETTEELAALETELNRVLRSIKLENTEIDLTPKILDKEKAQVTFDKLVPLLSSRNTDALQLIGELKEIPGTDEVAEQIESLNFSPALKMLTALREKLGV